MIKWVSSSRPEYKSKEETQISSRNWAYTVGSSVIALVILVGCISHSYISNQRVTNTSLERQISNWINVLTQKMTWIISGYSVVHATRASNLIKTTNFNITQKCTYLGPSPIHKKYQWLSPSGRMYISQHVKFNEFEFPFASATKPTTLSNKPNIKA